MGGSTRLEESIRHASVSAACVCAARFCCDSADAWPHETVWADVSPDTAQRRMRWLWVYARAWI
eukprot:446108-Rhodomonas_salina.2